MILNEFYSGTLFFAAAGCPATLELPVQLYRNLSKVIDHPINFQLGSCQCSAGDVGWVCFELNRWKNHPTACQFQGSRRRRGGGGLTLLNTTGHCCVWFLNNIIAACNTHKRHNHALLIRCQLPTKMPPKLSFTVSLSLVPHANGHTWLTESLRTALAYAPTLKSTRQLNEKKSFQWWRHLTHTPGFNFVIDLVAQ